MFAYACTLVSFQQKQTLRDCGAEVGLTRGWSKEKDLPQLYFVVDGEYHPERKIVRLKDIKSIETLEKDAAVQRFGEKAIDGAILVTTNNN